MYMHETKPATDWRNGEGVGRFLLAAMSALAAVGLILLGVSAVGRSMALHRVGTFAILPVLVLCGAAGVILIAKNVVEGVSAIFSTTTRPINIPDEFKIREDEEARARAEKIALELTAELSHVPPEVLAQRRRILLGELAAASDPHTNEKLLEALRGQVKAMRLGVSEVEKQHVCVVGFTSAKPFAYSFEKRNLFTNYLISLAQSLTSKSKKLIIDCTQIGRASDSAILADLLNVVRKRLALVRGVAYSSLVSVVILMGVTLDFEKELSIRGLSNFCALLDPNGSPAKRQIPLEPTRVPPVPIIVDDRPPL